MKLALCQWTFVAKCVLSAAFAPTPRNIPTTFLREATKLRTSPQNGYYGSTVLRCSSQESSATQYTPSIVTPHPSSSPPARGIVVVDPFFHLEYVIDRAVHDYGVGVVRVLSPYMARGFQKNQRNGSPDDEGGTGRQQEEEEPFDHFSLTAPLEADELSRWLESIPFPITAVICESDSGLEYAERLACAIDDAASVATGDDDDERGGGAASVVLRHNGRNDARRDKYLMNRACAAAGVPTVRQALCASVDDAELRAMEFGCREDDGRGGGASVIVKPCRGVASDRVSLCTDLSSVRTAAEDILSSTVFGTHETRHDAVLVQDFVPGTEYAVDVCSKDGTHKTAALWMYERVSTSEDESNPFAYRSSTLVSSDDERHPTSKIIEYVESCLDALGIKWGLTHTEIKVTPDGDIRLMEVNVRQQNDNFVPMCGVCIGYNALDMCLSSYLDDEKASGENLFEAIPSRPTLKNFGMVVSLVCYAEGTLKKINHVKAIEQLDSFVHMEIYPGFRVGSTVQRSRDIRTDGGWVHLVNEDEGALMRDYERICEFMYTMFDVVEEEALLTAV